MHKELLIKLLGLEATASDEAISNAAGQFQKDMVSFRKDAETQIETLTNRAETAEALATTAKEAADKIANEAKAMAEELVNSDIERFKDVVTNVDEVKAALIENRAGTLAVLKNIKVSNSKPAKAAPLHDPNKVQPEGESGVLNNTADRDDEKARAVWISNRAHEIASTQKISHQQAWAKAAQEAKIVNTK